MRLRPAWYRAGPTALRCGRNATRELAAQAKHSLHFSPAAATTDQPLPSCYHQGRAGSSAAFVEHVEA
eukprot:4739237-Pleurochrysis_carterae.AAC.2